MINNKRINSIIELLEQKQPVYYTQTDIFTYENGKKMGNTWADYIRLNLEHGPFDIKGVSDFMKGLFSVGPLKSGHKTPAVIAELPMSGTDEYVIHSNAWVVNHLLATGIHGLLLCHAENPCAVKALAEIMRYSFQTIGVGDGLSQGRRGHGGQKSAAKIWDIDETDYLEKADLWPLNPNGELILGLKIENTRALSNVDLSTSIKGVIFAEWGPGDMGMSLGYPEQHNPPYPKEMLEIRNKVFNACKNNNIYFLNAVYNKEELISCIDKGIMFMRIPDDDTEGKLADIGRRYTNRKMPW